MTLPKHKPKADPAPDAVKNLVLEFSHDVVNPLMSVLALSQVLLLEDRGDARMTDDLKRIHDAAEEALMLVRSLTTRIISGTQDPDL